MGYLTPLGCGIMLAGIAYEVIPVVTVAAGPLRAVTFSKGTSMFTIANLAIAAAVLAVVFAAGWLIGGKNAVAVAAAKQKIAADLAAAQAVANAAKKL